MGLKNKIVMTVLFFRGCLKEIWINRKKVKLSPMESMLLEYLLEDQDLARTREELVDRMCFNSQENLYRTIYQMRKKIESHSGESGKRIIQAWGQSKTVKGNLYGLSGYQIHPDCEVIDVSR